MDKISKYFSEKIESAASFYGKRARLIDARYLALVERLANKTVDKVLADFYRNTMRPERILATVDEIRGLLKDGQVIEADRELERLTNQLQFVDSRSKYPIFRTGLKQHQSLGDGRIKVNRKRKSAADREHLRWCAKAREAWKINSKLTVSSCARYLCEKYKLKAKQKTVADVIRNLRPPKKVGDAG